MYFIIFWEEYYQVVPDCWVNCLEKTFASPSSLKCNMTNVIKRKIKSGNDWKIIAYRLILRPYETYEKARETEKSCVDISTSDDVQLAALNNLGRTLPVKRLIISKKFYGDSEDSDMRKYKYKILLYYYYYSK